METKNLSYLCIGILFLSNIALATVPPPSGCPSAKAIKQSGFKAIIHLVGQEYYAVQTSNFDTRQDWGFTTAKFMAQTSQEAYVFAMSELETLAGPTGSVYDKKTDTWTCAYTMNKGFTGTASYPIYR